MSTERVYRPRGPPAVAEVRVFCKIVYFWHLPHALGSSHIASGAGEHSAFRAVQGPEVSGLHSLGEAEAEVLARPPVPIISPGTQLANGMQCQPIGM